LFRWHIIIFFFFISGSLTVSAQELPVQTIKGTVIDRSIKTPLAGATVVLVGSQTKATITDGSGNFRLERIPVGRRSILISFIGYKPVTLTNLSVESGKELVLTVEMDDQLTMGKEIILQSKPNKSMALNELAMVSARMFSVEETRRFAAGINDPSRIAASFAGVMANGDGNSLIIRGNAPNGLLWRMEGVDIPNPNHFSRVGTSGGGISILSAQLLANSDFITGAFPAEYGNALSGVFDIRLRAGNKEKREHTISINTIGIDAATEGYFKKGYGGSYLVNYRYGFLTLMQKLGFNIGDAPTTFQDLSFNIHLPTKKIGNFSLFGFGGLSQQKSIASNDSITWTTDPSKRYGSLDLSNTGAVGITHNIFLNKKTLLKTVYSINTYNYRQEDNRLDKYNGPLIISRKNQFREHDAVLSIVATHKFNKHHLLKMGIFTTGKVFDLHQREAVGNVLKDKVKSEGSTRLTNFFTEWKCDPVNRLSFHTGLHIQYFSLNHKSSLEPRIGLRYQAGKYQSISIGFGLHSQIQPLGDYFARVKVGNDTLQPNIDLGFSRSRHYVLGYSIQLAPNWNLKTEIYYQSLFNIPVTAGRATSFSLINLDDDYAIDALNNNGKGKNYGLEFTLQRWWSDQFYLLSTLSLYQSTYQASDKIWRDTRYNSNTAWTFLMGKEWNMKSKKPSTLGVDIKMVHTGGLRVTPINLAQSITQRRTVLDNNRIYGEKLPSFFRIDLQAEWKFELMRRTKSFILGVQNLTDRKNPESQYYDVAQGKIRYSYLFRLIPVIGFKVDL